MAKGKSASASSKAQATSYNSRYEKNRRRRLEKHLARCPDDAQAQAALGNITYRRKKPGNQGGWVMKQREKEFFKNVTGRNRLKAAAWVQSIARRGENAAKHDRQFGRGKGKTQAA